MNIFVVDKDPTIAAKNLCDKHVVKMIVEGCQMLSTIHRMYPSHAIYAPVELYKESFRNHPCTVWARESTENYMWLAEHTLGLSFEYTHRYNKIHKAHEIADWFCHHIPTGIVKVNLTPFAQAMPDKYKVANDAVSAYRNYYIGEKSRFAKWKYTEIPDWYSKSINTSKIQDLSNV